MHRNFTREGKIAAIPNEVEAAKNILDFENKVREAGIDTVEAGEHIQKALVAMSRNFNSLVKGTPAIRINKEMYSVGKEFEQKYLQEDQVRLLTEGQTSEDQDSKTT